MITPQAITAALIADSATAYYTAPASIKRAQIKKVTFHNTDTSARTVTVNLVPSAGSARDTNELIAARSLQPDETWDCLELVNQILLAGGTLQCVASVASKINIQGTVLEHTW